MINIFGKLYTLLRRPNQQNETPEPASPAQEEEKKDDAAQAAPGPANEVLTDSWIHVKTDKELNALNTSGTDLDAVQTTQQTTEQIDEQLDVKPVSEQQSNEMVIEDKGASVPVEVARNNTMDMEAMSKLVEEMQSAEEEKTEKKPDPIPASPGLAPSIDPKPTENKESLNEDLPKSTESAVDKASLIENSAKPIQEETDKTAEKSQTKEEDNTEKPSSSEVNEDGKNKDVKKQQDQKKDQGDTAGKSKKKATQKGCKFFNRGQKCFKGNRCPFSHNRDAIEEKEAVSLKEEDFETYNDFVNAMTAQGTNILPKEMIYKLGYQKCPMEAMGAVVIRQHKLAFSKQRWHWVSQARYFAELLFPNTWIEENLYTKDGPKKSKARDKPIQRKSKYNVNEQYEGRKSMCQDVRLLENPNLPCISSNLGKKKKEAAVKPGAGKEGADVDKFVTDYTNGIINEAVRQAVEETDNTDKVIRGVMREAMDGGLSESIIMEVIDDITSTTPSKRGKVNKPDSKRTPRKRPDELAIGFNYLSTELVKHSPKTVDGGIICMDTLPPSKERLDQIAFGFNFHADKLVKDSPKSETGEVLIPGVVSTPGRKTRDQLAIGFNYHANLIVKESPKSLNTENKSNKSKKGKSGKKKLYQAADMPEENQFNGCLIDHTGDASFKSKKTNEKERFAIGFSKNADLLAAQADKMVVNVLGEVNTNVNSQHIDNLDVSLEEERNNSELDDSFVPTMVPTMLPAGSLW